MKKFTAAAALAIVLAGCGSHPVALTAQSSIDSAASAAAHARKAGAASGTTAKLDAAISKAIAALYTSGDDSALKSVGAIKLTPTALPNVSQFKAKVREMADGMTGSASFSGTINTSTATVLTVDRD